MKKLLLFICALTLCLCTVGLCACSVQPSDKGTELNLIGFTRVEDDFNLTVRNAQSTFDFTSKIEIDSKSSYVVSKNSDGSEVVQAEAVSLKPRDNVLYVTVTNKYSIAKTYKATIRRNPMLTVSFVDENGDALKSINKQSVEEGYLATQPSNPQKTGYTFVSWDFDFEQTVITQNVNIKSNWTANEYDVTFNSNGAGEFQSKKVTFDSTYGTLPTPTREGYFFFGWFTDESCSKEVTSESIVKTPSNHTLYASWCPIGINLELEPGGAYYVITGLKDLDAEDVIIPTAHNGIPIKQVKENAFSNATALATVYYQGSQNAWQTISVGANNQKLTGATKFYDYEMIYYSYDSCKVIFHFEVKNENVTEKFNLYNPSTNQTAKSDVVIDVEFGNKIASDKVPTATHDPSPAISYEIQGWTCFINGKQYNYNASSSTFVPSICEYVEGEGLVFNIYVKYDKWTGNA